MGGRDAVVGRGCGRKMIVVLLFDQYNQFMLAPRINCGKDAMRSDKLPLY